MIVHSLPRPGRRREQPRTGIYTDHTLFTEIVESAYDHPEHMAGLGILMMLTGEGECALDHRREKLSGTDWVLVERGSRFSLHVSQAGAQPVLLFFHTEMVERLWSAGSFALLERAHAGRLTFYPQLQQLVSLGDSCSSFVALKADSIVREILGTLIRKAREAIALAGRLDVAKGATRIDLFKRISAARDYMIMNYASAITLDDIAGVAMLHRQHVLRMFRQCYQLTPHQFLTEVRLQSARQRLLHSGDSVTMICQQAGFESLSSFSGLFRQHFGLSPVAFRRSREVRN